MATVGSVLEVVVLETEGNSKYQMKLAHGVVKDSICKHHIEVIPRAGYSFVVENARIEHNVLVE